MNFTLNRIKPNIVLNLNLSKNAKSSLNPDKIPAKLKRHAKIALKTLLQHEHFRHLIQSKHYNVKRASRVDRLFFFLSFQALLFHQQTLRVFCESGISNRQCLSTLNRSSFTRHKSKISLQTTFHMDKISKARFHRIQTIKQ